SSCVDVIAATSLCYVNSIRFQFASAIECKNHAKLNPQSGGRHMLSREEWLPLARKLDWDYSYVREDEVFPEVISGRPWLPHSEWQEWEESFKTSYREYVDNQYEKDMADYAVRDAVGRLENVQKLAVPWLNGLKVHAAALPLAE